jgi:hypothetical protein
MALFYRCGQQTRAWTAINLKCRILSENERFRDNARTSLRAPYSGTSVSVSSYRRCQCCIQLPDTLSTPLANVRCIAYGPSSTVTQRSASKSMRNTLSEIDMCVSEVIAITLGISYAERSNKCKASPRSTSIRRDYG